MSFVRGARHDSVIYSTYFQDILKNSRTCSKSQDIPGQKFFSRISRISRTSGRPAKASREFVRLLVPECTRMNVTNIIVYRYRSRFDNTVTYFFIIHPTEATGYPRLNDVIDVTSRHSVSNNLRHRSCILCRPKNFTTRDVQCLM
jgi:hypothetical protein